LTEENSHDPLKPYREALQNLADRVLQFHALFIKKESGFALPRIIECKLLILKYNPIGSGYVPLPKFIASKTACVNVHNFDDRCFGYAILSALKDPLPGHHKSEARYYSEADFRAHGLDQIHYPVSVEMVPKLE
jgi:hypothetical protein